MDARSSRERLLSPLPAIAVTPPGRSRSLSRRTRRSAATLSSPGRCTSWYVCRYAALVAGLINGGTWALWHAPFVSFPGYYANTAFNPDLWCWLSSIVLPTLIFVWVYNNTNRSVLAILVIHEMLNETGSRYQMPRRTAAEAEPELA